MTCPRDPRFVKLESISPASLEIVYSLGVMENPSHSLTHFLPENHDRNVGAQLYAAAYDIEYCSNDAQRAAWNAQREESEGT